MSIASLFNSTENDSFLRKYQNAVRDRITQSPYNKKDIEILDLYFNYAKNSCFLDANALFKKVVQIEQEGPIFEAAQQIQKMFFPLVDLCEKGKEKIELAKSLPAEGPRARHWLALHLNELNTAYYRKDRNAMKAAIKKINYIQGKIKEITQISAETKILSIACQKRIDHDVDPDQAMRKELYSWSGYFKAKVADYLTPLLLLGLGGFSFRCYQQERLELFARYLGLCATYFPFLDNTKEIGLYWFNTIFSKPDSSIFNNFTPEEKEKLLEIQKQIQAVASALELPENMDRALQIVDHGDISVKGVLGSTPTLTISKSDFDVYESNFTEKWKGILNELPNHPLDLARFIDEASPEKRNELHLLVLEMGENDIIDQKVLRGILAHELGHLRRVDISSNGLFFLLVICLRSLVLYTNPTNTSVWNSLIATILSTGVQYPPLFRLINAPLSQMIENGADAQSRISSDCREGLITAQKNCLLRDLVNFQRNENSIGSSCVQETETMLKSQDLGSSHPNNAKRLLNLLEAKDRPYEPPSRLFSTAKIALTAGIHLTFLAIEAYQFYSSFTETYKILREA